MTLKAALLGLCIVAGATSARAETLFDTFQSTCLKAQGSATQALGAADAKGWAVMPKEQAASLAKNFGKAAVAFEGRISAADRRALAIGDVDTPAGAEKVKLTFCIVAGSPADGESVKTESAGYAAVSPDTHTGNAPGLFYAFTDDAGKHKQISNPQDDAEILPLVRSGRARILVVVDQPGLALLAYALPAKSPN